MKLIRALIFMLVLVQAASAQKVRFTDPTNEWVINHEFEDASHGHIHRTSTATYKYSGTVNQSGYTYSQFADGSLVREDTTAGIVYIIYPNDPAEHVLYNYNMALGDTLGYDSFGEAVVVDRIDTILINGYEHKAFRLLESMTGYVNNYVIEGIGNISKLNATWFEHNDGSYGYGLLCFKNKGQAPTSDKLNLSWCEYVATNTKSIQKVSKEISIYPQPTHNEFTIQLPTEVTGKLTITNSMGQTVYTYSIEHQESININGISLNAGVYYYRIDSSNTAVNYSGKLLID